MAAFYLGLNVLNNVQDPNLAIMKVADFLAPNSSGSSVCTVLTADPRVRHIYIPAQRSWSGVYWIHLVRLSVDDMVSGA